MWNTRKHTSFLKKLFQSYFTKLLLLIFLFLFGCASLPRPLQDIPALKNVLFKDVKENPDKYINVSLLWGGRITSCTNTQEGTVFEILYFPLDREG
ncbi:MAG: Slp family lipoprotein, partial [Thermodesulfovibrio sp.]